MVTNTDSAVFASVAPKRKITHDLPLARFQVVDVDVIARRNVSNGMTNVLAVFQDRFAIADVLEGKLVPQRDGVIHFHADGFVRVHDPAGQILSSLNALNDNHTNGVAFVMDQKIGRCATQLGCLSENESGKKNSYIRIEHVL